MRHIWKILIPLLSVVVLLLASAGGVAAASYPVPASDGAVQGALLYLRAQQSVDGSIGGFGDSAWACIAIAAAGEDPNEWENGGQSLVDFLKAGPPGGDLSGEFNMGTYLARMVLAAVSAGEDPEAFGSWSGSNLGVTITNGDYLGALVSLYDGTQFLQDLTGAADSAETLNDDFWAVRALVTAGESPYSPMVQSAVQFIIGNQEADGGWTWGTVNHGWYMLNSTDVDNTAAAILALCLGRRVDSEAVQDGLGFLRANQDASGGFIGYWTGVNVMSTAWCVDAIGAGSQHPDGSAWTPDDASPVDYLLGSQFGDGSFDGSIRSTSDAIVALVGSYYRAPASPVPVTVGGEALRPDKLALLVLPVLAGACVLLLGALALRRKFE
ncbi:MAG: terpene cyclase/mutase family protein [Dehalococcoidia bacterium]|nr:terpene cyclase/mutase family protein [Dehalococcoidia bacterium]